MYDNIVTKEFYPIWKKYKPVILKMMIDSSDGNQQEYKLSKHEFTDVNSRKNASCSFKLEVYKGKSTKLTKSSVIATDLITMLKQSAKATELMNEKIYNISLDSSFTLLVNSKSAESE